MIESIMEIVILTQKVKKHLKIIWKWKSICDMHNGMNINLFGKGYCEIAYKLTNGVLSGKLTLI